MIFPELITKYGYPVESHQVTSADGYIISVTRIPSKKVVHPWPVLLVHGLLASSADFLIIGPNNSLAYLLADRGYDTGARQLNYIGHSQGTTVFFVMASSRPEYNDKIAHMYALSPAVFVKHMRSPLSRWLVQHANLLQDLFDTFGIHRFLPHSDGQLKISQMLCPLAETENLCMQIVSLTVGPNPKMVDMVAMQVLTGHDPAGASVKQLMHFAQLHRSGKFRQYDYGRRNNTERYSHWKPPAYNLSAITAPVTIFYARNDWLIDPRDALRFARLLPKEPTVHLVEDDNFNHLDFTMAKNARPMVYERILSDLAKRERTATNGRS
uniref:Uncharacterized protein n=1 Tax=Anopheles atroparvus TaxID=41427 RepID=A0A182JAQ3_ANOAO